MREAASFADASGQPVRPPCPGCPCPSRRWRLWQPDFSQARKQFRRPLRRSAYRMAAGVPFSRVTRCCRKVWAGPLFLHIPERADKIGERLPVDARRRIGELFIPAPCRCGRPLPLPTPPGSRFTAHAPVVRVHPADASCGSRIFPKQALPSPLEAFSFPHGDRRAVFPRHPLLPQGLGRAPISSYPRACR